MGDKDRLFNPHGRRHFRRTYNPAEVWVGGLIILALTLITAWVAYKGAHPSPDLFGNDPRLIPKGSPTASIRAESRRPPSSRERRTPQTNRFDELNFLPEGWMTGPASHFGPDNLYKKINGREGFYKSLGFQSLDFISLSPKNTPETTIDIEWFNLGELPNALGAFSAERPTEAKTQSSQSGLQYVHRNMAALVRGPHYIRIIGSSETPAFREILENLASRFAAGVDGESLPWSFQFFTGLNVSAHQITIEKENAFSFEFAHNVHIAALNDDIEVFVSPQLTAADASTLTQAFRKGFLSIGTPSGKNLVKDRYLNTFAGIRSEGHFVYGVRGSPSSDRALAELARVQAHLRSLSPDLLKQALAEATASPRPSKKEAAPTAAPEPAEASAEDTDPYGEEEYTE